MGVVTAVCFSIAIALSGGRRIAQTLLAPEWYWLVAFGGLGIAYFFAYPRAEPTMQWAQGPLVIVGLILAGVGFFAALTKKTPL